MSATSIGLPKLKIAFEAAARQTINRSKKGYAAVFVRDAKAQGLHRLSSDTMIPSELGEANRSYIKTAFVGSDRESPAWCIWWSSPRERRTPLPWRAA